MGGARSGRDQLAFPIRAHLDSEPTSGRRLPKKEMKGIVVFDDRSDLAFYSLDKDMEHYVKERVRQLEGEAGAEVSE